MSVIKAAGYTVAGLLMACLYVDGYESLFNLTAIIWTICIAYDFANWVFPTKKD